MIKSYTNESEWASATKPTTESTVGLLLDSNTPVINGVNVLVTIPKYGDAVVLDADGNIRFIAFGTFNNATFPSSWTKVGVVYEVKGKKVKFVSHVSLGGIQYSPILRYQITGYNLDGAEHTVIYKTRDNSGNETTLSFTYNASTISELISQFNSWAESNDPNSRSPYMYLDENGELQFVETWVTWWQVYDGFDGLSASWNMAQEIPEVSRTPMKNGYDNVYCNVNIGAIKRWGGRTPSNEVYLDSVDTAVSKDAFENSEYCSRLRSAYGDYDTYLDATSVKDPSNRGVMSWRNRGYDFTYMIADAKYKTKAGSDEYMYTAPHRVSTFGYAANSLVAPGKWYISDVDEMVTLMRPITVGNNGINSVDQYDRVNQTIYAMGGDLISTNAYRWCSCRYVSDYMWFYSSYGYLNTNYFYYVFTVVPVCCLRIA